MLFGWRHRVKLRQAVETTADEFIERYGDRASHLVRLQMVETAKSADPANAFWSQVYREIKARRGRE